MTKIKESEFVFQNLGLYNTSGYYRYTNSPIAFDGTSSGFLFINNERILSNVMVENPSLSKNELIFARNDIRDKDTLVYKHSQKFLGFNFTKNTLSSFTTSLNYLADEWARFNAIFSNKLLTTRLSTSKSNVMFKRYFNNVKSMIDMSSGSTDALSEYRALEVNRDMTCDNHYLFSLDSSYKSAGLLSVLNDTNNSQKYILFTDASCSQGVWNDFPQYNFQSLFIYKGDDINIETYSSTFAANTQNTGDILKNTLLTTNAIPNNQLTYLFTDFTNRSIYFLKTSQYKSTAAGALKAYRHFTFTTILKATWGVNETILNAKFAANTIQNFDNITTAANFQASSFGVLGQAGSHADARYFTKYLGYMGQDFAGQNYFLYINEGATRDTGTASTNVENVISNLETTLKNSWTTAIIKENPTNGTVTNLKNINYTYITYPYEIGNTNRNVAITATTSVALTLNKNNTFNLTTTNVTYYAPVSPANNDIFRVQHLGSTGSFKVNVSATNSTVLVPLTTSVSAIKIYYFKYNSSNTTWELQTDLGYFPIPGTHLWNEPRTGLVSTYLTVPSKAIVSPSNSNIYYFYAPAYTNTDFSSSKVNAGLSIYTPILYTWDKSLTTSDAITILDTSITYPESDTWLTYANTHTEGYNKGTGYADPGTEFYYNHETAGKTRESHDNSQLYKFFHHNFITKVGSRYFLNHCIFYGTDHNANILVDNSNNGLSTLQKEKCRKIITYEINTSNWRSLTYHSSYGFNDTQLGFLPLDETNFTKILINQKNSVSILNFDTTTGWVLSALYEGNFIQISRDSNDTIWAVKCNINLSEKLYGNLLTNLISQKVIFELHKLSEIDSGGLLNLSYRVELNEENKENIFYQSTIDDATNSIIKNLKLSVYDINNIRQSILVNLQIQNGDGKVLFNDNGLEYISVTSDYGDDVNIEVLIQESQHFYIVASIDIL